MPKTRTVPAALVASGVALTLAASAAGFQEVTPQGAPGALQVFQVVGSHHDPCGGTTSVGGVPYPIDCWQTWLSGAAHVVGRSPRTRGAQRVVAQHSILRSDGTGRFHQVATATARVTIPAGVRAVRLPALNVLPTAGHGYYRVVTAVAWTTPGGRVLGSRGVALIHDGDYACSTRFPCQAGGGSVYLGGAFS